MGNRTWKNVIAIVLIAAAVFSNPIPAKADYRTAQDYMAEGIKAAYDNMHLVYQTYYDENGKLEVQPAGHVAIWQEWDEDWKLISRTYLGPDGKPVNTVDGYSKAEWKTDENDIRTLSFYDANGKKAPGVNTLLASDIKAGNDGWSEWMEPNPDTENYCFTVGYVDLGEKSVGDKYICKVEIEFMNVTGIEGQGFWFRAQGDADSSWGIGNVWNDGLVSLREPPEDNVYRFRCTSYINEKMAEANTFALGFRCDNWASGKFRIRNLEIIKK